MGFTPDSLFLCVKLRSVLVIALKILKRVYPGTGLGSRDPKNMSSQDPKSMSSQDPRA